MCKKEKMKSNCSIPIPHTSLKILVRLVDVCCMHPLCMVTKVKNVKLKLVPVSSFHFYLYIDFPIATPATIAYYSDTILVRRCSFPNILFKQRRDKHILKKDFWEAS